MRKSGLITMIACFCILAGCGNANNNNDDDILRHTVAINKVDVTISADNSKDEVAVTPTTAQDKADTSKDSKNNDTIRDIKSVSYNGVTFQLGDTSSSFVNKLGNTTAPTEKVGSCVTDGMSIRYLYGKMTLEFDEKSNKLNQVKIIDDGVASEKKVYVVGGIYLGCDESLVKEAIPQAKVNTIANIHVYNMEEADASFEITCRESKVSMIRIASK